MTAAPGNGRSGLERTLGLFAEVKPGEGVTSLLLSLNVFLLLTAYYIIKPVREALILSGGGAELKSYLAGAQVLLLLVAVPAYARLADRMPRRRLINTVTLFFMACLVLFYGLAQVRVPLGVVFFVWVGIFNMMIVAQFWSFANDVYTPDEGKRLFAIVAFGASFGAVVGSKITSLLIAPLGVYQLLLVSSAILGLALAITNVVDRRTAGRAPTAGAVAEPEPPLGEGGAFELVRKSRYLLMIAFMMLLLNWVNTIGEYILGKLVEDTAAETVAAGASGGLDEGEWIGKFYSDFFFVVNIAGVLIQMFLVSRVIKYLGVRVALLILPVIALGGYALMAVVPLLSVVRWAKTAENATDYSLMNTVRHVLFLPTTREQKYKAKQAIDSFFVRAGDVMHSLTVLLGTSVFAFGIKGFTIFNMALVAVWMVLAVLIGREFKRLARDGARDA